MRSQRSATRSIQPPVVALVPLSAVGIVIGATIAIQLVTSAELKVKEDSAVILDTARQQQALAQQIAVRGTKAAEASRSSELQYGQILGRFARTHEHWRRLDEATDGSPPSSTSFSALYGGGDPPLASLVDGFLAKVRAIDGASADEPRTLADRQDVVRFASETFPAGLDQVVVAYSRANLAKVRFLRRTRLMLVVLALATLAIEAVVLTRSLLRRTAPPPRTPEIAEPGDPEVGLLSAETFAERSLAEIVRAHRYKRPISVLTIAAELAVDRDEAKARYDEQASRRNVRDDLSRTLRPSDVVGLSDDGTLLVVLPETDLYAADLTAHRLLRELTKRPTAREGGVPTVSFTIGVAQIHADEMRIEGAVDRARSAIRDGQAVGEPQVFVATRS